MGLHLTSRKIFVHTGLRLLYYKHLSFKTAGLLTSTLLSFYAYLLRFKVMIFLHLILGKTEWSTNFVKKTVKHSNNSDNMKILFIKDELKTKYSSSFEYCLRGI